MRALTAFCGIAILVAAPASAQAPAAAGDPDVLGAQRLFSAWLESQIAYRGLPGIVVGVVSDQDLVWAKGFGYADVAKKVPMTPATKFRMASHSKLFTATAIMQLREQGKVRLDDPVANHLPWFKLKPAGEDDGAVTIEQLLSHSSGLPRELNDHWTSWKFPTEAEVRDGIAEKQAAFPPATRWKYSNLAYTIAGMVVEKESGMAWADYVQRNIYDPLGMTSSSVDKDVPGLAIGYGRRMPDGSREVRPFVSAAGMGSATGITSTVEDMARFVSAQFRTGTRGGNRILSTGSLREMHRVRSLENTWSSGNGIGFSVSRVGDKSYIGHGGGYPGYTTQTFFEPVSKVGVIVLTNTNDSDPFGIAMQLRRTVGDAVGKATTPKPQVVAWDPSWERFAGLYRSSLGDMQIVLLNKRLVLVTPNGANVDDPTGLEPLGEGRFRYTARTGGGPVGEVVRFVEGSGGTRMIMGDWEATRVR